MAKKGKSKKEPSEKRVEIVTIIDISGSMEMIKDDAIGGFNSFLEEQKKLPGEAIFTLIQFNDQVETIYNGIEIEEVKPYNINTYIPRGATALFDAIGRGIGIASRRGVEDRKVIVAILTDGQENSSKEMNKQKTADLIAMCEKQGWVFMFLAAGFSQFEAERMSGDIGIKAVNTRGFEGFEMRAAYGCVSDSVASYRSSGKMNGIRRN